MTLAQEMRSALAGVTGYAMQAQEAYMEWQRIHKKGCTYECTCSTWRNIHEEARLKLYKAQDEFIARFAQEAA